ncbi:MAG: NAD-dependent epimerase/dehydratase family protein [Bacteriovoracaceae bacterium]|jgi:UDP-glucose 4-epimerase|nr:NAD-dependent epimerase/dehydratase family protein [Bacteriovoracaceae bacterium]
MVDLKNINNILLIGMAGGLAQLTANLITIKHPHIKILGVDSRKPTTDLDKNNIEFRRMRYTRGNFEKVFREYKFDLVLHLGRMSHANNDNASLIKRLDLNLMGTSRILDLALKHNVKKVIILSTYHVYGALHDNPVFIDENHPLRASIRCPELRDVVEMDQICTNWMWKNKNEIETIVLRPCSIIGPQIRNTMSQYLTTPYAPLPVDFNPMFQFLHEFDMGQVLMESISKVPTGIYNVAPDDVISLKDARRKTEVPSIPVPIFMLEQAAKVIKFIWSFPDYFINYIKFSCIIDNNALKKHIGDDFFRFNARESLELLKMD